MENYSKGEAAACFVMGIPGIICLLLGWGAFLSVVFGIAGIAVSSSAVKQGYDSGLRHAGNILSCIAMVGWVVILGFKFVSLYDLLS